MLSCFICRKHLSIWKWIQKYTPQNIKAKRKRKLSEYIVDETMLKVGSSENIWLWITIEPENKQTDSPTIYVYVSSKRNMFIVAEQFLS